VNPALKNAIATLGLASLSAHAFAGAEEDLVRTSCSLLTSTGVIVLGRAGTLDLEANLPGYMNFLRSAFSKQYGDAKIMPVEFAQEVLAVIGKSKDTNYFNAIHRNNIAEHPFYNGIKTAMEGSKAESAFTPLEKDLQGQSTAIVKDALAKFDGKIPNEQIPLFTKTLRSTFAIHVIMQFRVIEAYNKHIEKNEIPGMVKQNPRHSTRDCYMRALRTLYNNEQLRALPDWAWLDSLYKDTNGDFTKVGSIPTYDASATA